jgi:peptidoglycan/xylan/chitin deacetylase (PgdA/CDA1 family)
MPRTGPPTVYLTYDDGPNAATTPVLLDVLAREQVRATFFLIAREITDRTVPLVTRMFAEGHAVALHSDSRLDLLMSPAAFARKLTTNADRIERLTGHRPIRAFRPHAGWRSVTMYAGLKRIDYRLIGWDGCGGTGIGTVSAQPLTRGSGGDAHQGWRYRRDARRQRL